MEQEKTGIYVSGTREEHIEKIKSTFTIEEVLMMISLAMKFDSADPRFMLKDTPKHIAQLAESSIAGVILKLAVALPPKALEMIKKSCNINLGEMAHKWDEITPSAAPGVH
jgi:hypothetical protein